MRSSRLSALALLVAFVGLHCSDNETQLPSPPNQTTSDAAVPSPIEELPIQETLTAPGLSGPVDVVRDDGGIPHVFANTLADAAYAQGYMMAQDRWMFMDLGRRQASGRVAELVGVISPAALTSDIRYRAFRLRDTAKTIWQNMQASTRTEDRVLVDVLKAFTRGVNAWQGDLKAGKYALPSEVALLYGVSSVTPWEEIDSLTLGELQSFELAFDAESEIAHTALSGREAEAFGASNDPAKLARVGVADDLFRVAPFDPTYTSTTFQPGVVRAPAQKRGSRRPAPRDIRGLERILHELRGMGRDPNADRGSNNWAVRPALSTTGNALVANDTHLSLSNPALFYLVHLSTKDGYDAMGAQFAGIPLVTLGMNRHVAWGGTVSYLDVTDVYREQVVDCTSTQGKCVVFKGAQVPLTTREETINIGSNGEVLSTVRATFYDVPHHGPIIPRATGQGTEALVGTEYSVRYTGFEPGALLRAVYRAGLAKTAFEWQEAIEQDFSYGGQNWVAADDAGNVVWTQATRLPKRPANTKPWEVLPGDGTAEWYGYFNPALLPQERNPAKGYLITANNDPIGVTADNNPMNETLVEGHPFYLGWTYDPGTRVGRINRLFESKVQGGGKFDRDAMSAVQADAYSEYGKFFNPTMIEALEALAAEHASPGDPGRAEIAPLVAGAKPEVKVLFSDMANVMKGWSFDTPAGSPESTGAELTDTKATLLHAVWLTRFAKVVLDDELAVLQRPLPPFRGVIRVLTTLVSNPTQLRTGDNLFGNLASPGDPKTKRYVASKAMVQALDYLVSQSTFGPNANNWRWGTAHSVTPSFALPGLRQRTVPRHGTNGTVDVANHGVEDDDYTFGNGAAIRFVCELDPVRGPIARNVIPGGEVFDPKSPHYGDLLELWAKNQAYELPFAAADVANRSKIEVEKNKIGRRRFTP